MQLTVMQVLVHVKMVPNPRKNLQEEECYIAVELSGVYSNEKKQF